MNLSGIGSFMGAASQLFGAASPLGALGTLAAGVLAGSPSQGAEPSDPFSAVVALTEDVDSIAASGFGGGLPGSIAGMLA